MRGAVIAMLLLLLLLLLQKRLADDLSVFSMQSVLNDA